MDLLAVLAGAVMGGLLGVAAGVASSRVYCRRKCVAMDLIVAAATRERLLVRLRRGLSRKPRKRYIVFEVIGGPVEPEDLEEAIRNSFVTLFGAPALSVSMIRLAEFDERNMRGILSVRREFKYHALAALALVRRVKDRRVFLVPVLTSGTIKRARKKAWGR